MTKKIGNEVSAGILSISLGAISLITLAIGLFTGTRLLAIVTTTPALAGLVSGLAAQAKRQNHLMAWTGIISSSIALLAGATVYGIGHGLG
ncbi:MAG: hypothetical protein TUN42_05045 [Dehalogenimonas sp.]